MSLAAAAHQQRPAGVELQASCRQVLAHVLAQADALFCRHPTWNLDLLRDRHVLGVCHDQPEFAAWLRRLQTLLRQRRDTVPAAADEDTIPVRTGNDDNRLNPSAVELGWWAASLYLDETLRAYPPALVADPANWLTALAAVIKAGDVSCRLAALGTFTSLCVAVADAADARLDVLMQHVAPVLAQITSASASDSATVVGGLDALARLSAVLRRTVRPHTARMLAHCLSFADHDNDSVRAAAARAAATVAASCTESVAVGDYVGGLDRLLDRYLLPSLTDAAVAVAIADEDHDAPFPTRLRFGPAPIRDLRRRWRFLCTVVGAVLDDDANAVAVSVDEVLRTFARVLHCTVPVQRLGSVSSHAISCLQLFAALPALQADVLAVVAHLCNRLGRRLLPHSPIVADMLMAAPLSLASAAVAAAIGAVGVAILDSVVIPSLTLACDAIRPAAAVPVHDTLVGGRRRKRPTPPAQPVAPPRLDDAGPYLDVIVAALRHVGDRLPDDTLRAVAGALQAALAAPCGVGDERRRSLYQAYVELVSARYRAGPDLGLLRQAGRVFAAGQYGRHADLCARGLALVRHLAAPAVPVALHQRVVQDSVLQVADSADCTVSDDRPGTGTLAALSPAVTPGAESIAVSGSHPKPLPNLKPPRDPSPSRDSPMVDAGAAASSSPGPVRVVRNQVVVTDRDETMLEPPVRVESPARVIGVKRKEPEVVRDTDPETAALLVDIGPDESDDQAPLWCF